MTKCPRTIFHPPTVPSNHLPRVDEFRGRGARLCEVGEMRNNNPILEFAQNRFDFSGAVSRAEERHWKTAVPNFPSLRGALQRRPESRSVISGRGLDVNRTKQAGAHQLS